MKLRRSSLSIAKKDVCLEGVLSFGVKVVKGVIANKLARS